jgi:hypothetical protein
VNPCVAAASDAQDLRAAGKLRDARASLLACSKRSCNAVVRSDCEKWLKEIDEQTPSLIVRVVDVRGKDVLGVQVTIDETPIDLDGTPVPLDPGQRVIRARTRSGDVVEQKTLIALGEKARVVEVHFSVALEQDGTRRNEKPAKAADGKRDDDKSPAPKKREEGSVVLPIVLTGIGVAALGTFGYFEIAGQSAYADLENGCYRTRSCTQAEVDPVKQQFLTAGIALGVSALALVSAAVVYFTRKPARGTALRLTDSAIAF